MIHDVQGLLVFALQYGFVCLRLCFLRSFAWLSGFLLRLFTLLLLVLVLILTLLLLFIFQVFDFSFDVLVVVFGVLILRFELESLLIMIQRVCPIAKLFIVAFFRFSALIKRVAEVVMASALQTGITRKQGLTKRLQGPVVVF